MGVREREVVSGFKLEFEQSDKLDGRVQRSRSRAKSPPRFVSKCGRNSQTPSWQEPFQHNLENPVLVVEGTGIRDAGRGKERVSHDPYLVLVNDARNNAQLSPCRNQQAHFMGQLFPQCAWTVQKTNEDTHI